MSKRAQFSLCISEKDYRELKSKGNIANYLRNLMWAKIDAYEELPTVEEILGKGRPKIVLVNLNDGMKNELEKRATKYGMEAMEYGKRVCARAWHDRQMETVSTKSEGDAVIEAMKKYSKLLGDTSLDADIRTAMEMLESMIQKKEQRNRYKRLIPEIQNLMGKGISLEDIVNVAKAMGESQ